MEQYQKIDMIKELRVGLLCKEQEVEGSLALLERGKGARELALALTALQESRHWVEESLCKLGLSWSYNNWPANAEVVGKE